MPRKGQSLASRLKATLDAEAREAQAAEEARQQRLADGRAAREELLTDLEGFAEAVGHLRVERTEDGLQLFFGDRSLSFSRVGDGDQVQVRFENSGDDHRLYREPQLGDKWAWRFRRHGREDRLVLWDTGLEELLAVGLALHVRDDVPIPSADSTPEGSGGARSL